MEKTKAALNYFFIILAFSACYAMIFLDMSGVAVILPQMQKNLFLTNNQIQWVMNSYILTSGIFLLLGGKLGDHYGELRIFQIGLIFFVAASVTCGMASSVISIILGRILQGLGACLLLPTIVVLIKNNFPDQMYGKGFGSILMVANLFFAIGPFLGGLLAEYFTWRGIFWINLPLGIIAFIVSAKLIIKSPLPDHKIHLDLLGILTSGIAFFSFILLLMQGGQWGWASPAIVSLLIISIVSFLCFIKIELRESVPLFEMRLFQNKIFMACNVIACAAYAVFASVIYLPIWFHVVFQYTPTQIGLAMIPVTVPTILAPRIAGGWRDRVGPRKPMALGAILTIFGLIWIASFAAHANYWLLFPGLLMYGFGLPTLVPMCVPTMMTAIPKQFANMAAAAITTFRQIALAFGIALIAIILSFYESPLAKQHSIKNFIEGFQNSLWAFLILSVISLLFVMVYIPNSMQAVKVETQQETKTN